MNNYEMQTHEGICKYCGQVQPVLAADQQDANLKISEECECGGAARERKLNAMEENLRATIGERAIDNGFRPLSEEQCGHVHDAAMSIFDGHAEKVSFKIGSTSITIQETSKGMIKISRATQKKHCGGGLM